MSLDERNERPMRRLRALARGLHWYLRELTGETAYERYVDHVRRRHPEAPAMSRRDFERRRLAAQDRPGARCC